MLQSQDGQVAVAVAAIVVWISDRFDDLDVLNGAIVVAAKVVLTEADSGSNSIKKHFSFHSKIKDRLFTYNVDLMQ